MVIEHSNAPEYPKVYGKKACGTVSLLSVRLCPPQPQQSTRPLAVVKEYQPTLVRDDTKRQKKYSQQNLRSVSILFVEQKANPPSPPTHFSRSLCPESYLFSFCPR